MSRVLTHGVGLSSGGSEGCVPPSRDHAQCGSFERGE